MGNNVSSGPLRRPSISREYKPNTVHRDYASPSSSPVRIKKHSVGSIDPGTASHDGVHTDIGMNKHSNTQQQQQHHQTQKQSQPGYNDFISPRYDYMNHQRASTPNVFLDNFADHDYFSRDRRSSEHIEIVDPNEDLLDDDEYGIDEDLVSTPVVETDDTKKVLIKYSNSSSDLYGYNSVYVVGSFNHWTEKYKMEPHFGKNDEVQYYKIQINLPIGIYRIKFLVNGEVRYSNHLPIATDKSGNVVNWFEVDNVDSGVFEAGAIEHTKITLNKRKSSVSFWNDSASSIIKSHSALVLQPSPEKLEYSQEIPEVCETNSDEILPADEEFLVKNPIPDLPVYLNNNYLNKYFNLQHQNNSNTDAAQTKKSVQGLNSHIIPHVNLNHLLTSNIKHNVLSVACTTRYSGKFVTQIMYSPSDYNQ